MKRIYVSEPQLTGNERRYVLDCLDTNRLTMGTYVREFENMFARSTGVRYAVSCMNGTVALHLALLALDLQPGDEVLIPTLTYVATANAVAYCGATPVLCDVEPGTWTIRHEELFRKRSKRTKGILPVHLYGHPAEMDMINSAAQHFGWWVLEDAAEATFGIYRGRPVGALGTAATFSFYGNKIITTAEGGMVTTNDQRLHERMLLLRGQGMSTAIRYYHPVIGYNYRMTNLQGALGLAQLENASSQIERRSEVWQQYSQWFAENEIVSQSVSPSVRHAHWMYTILLPLGVDKGPFMDRLDGMGIETRPAFIPMHAMPMYRASKDQFPIAEDVARRGVNLPTHAGLTDEDVRRVCTSVMEALQ